MREEEQDELQANIDARCLSGLEEAYREFNERKEPTHEEIQRLVAQEMATW